jgi:nucleoid-associated protein YgaU
MTTLKEAMEAKAKLEAQAAEARARKEAALDKARAAKDAGARAAAEGEASMADAMAVQYNKKLKEAEDALQAALAGAKKHTVATGETLSDIALKYYGRANAWQQIYDVNKGVIGDNPNKIKPGQEFIIP